MSETTILYLPVGQHELDLIAATVYRAFPPRLPEFNQNIVGVIEIIAEYR
jgi:hypothetical protein